MANVVFKEMCVFYKNEFWRKNMQKNFMNVLHVYSCPDHPFLGSPPFSSLPAIKLHESSSTEWLACDCLEPKYPALFFLILQARGA